MEITVKGMTCGHCVAALTKALEELPGVSQVRVDFIQWPSHLYQRQSNFPGGVGRG